MADNVAITAGSGTTVAADDVAGVYYQRVKVAHGADGSATDVSSASPLPVDTELAAAAALADAAANPTTPMVGAGGLLFNGTTWDRERGNTEGVLLASAARTAAAQSSIQTNYNARGVLLTLNVTAASGTGGLTVCIYGVDPIGSGGDPNLLRASVPVTTTGRKAYLLYPGNGSDTTFDLVLTKNGALPRSWFALVLADDASSYTYSLGYSMIV